MMPEDITVDVRMKEEKEEDDSKFRTGVNVRVSDTSGSPLTEATIQVTSDGGDYEEEKDARRMGMKTNFDDVPMPATVVIEADGYQTETIEISKEDAGTDVTRGY